MLKKRNKIFLLSSIIFLFIISFSINVFACDYTLKSAQSENNTFYNENTGNIAVVEDYAQLLTSEETYDVTESMLPCTNYCNVFFVTSDEYTSSVPAQATEYLMSISSKHGVSEQNSVIFLININPGIRELYIYSGEEAYKTITTPKANIITDNVYKIASEGDYALCAEKTFEYIYKIFSGQKISEPMRYITAALLAAFIGLFIGCFVYFCVIKHPKGGMQSGMTAHIKNLQVRRTRLEHHTVIHALFFLSGSGGKSGGGGGHFGGGGGRSSGGGGHFSGGGGHFGGGGGRSGGGGGRSGGGGGRSGGGGGHRF